MKNDCVNIECIFNDRLSKGLCVGVSSSTRSYHKDVIRLCWVKEKPSPNKMCKIETQAQMTPNEAVGIGVALIGARIVGESLLRNQPKEFKEGVDEKEKIAKKPACTKATP